MVQNPRLKYCYHAEFIDDDKVLLVSEKNSSLLSGRVYARILQEVVSGTLSVEEIVDRLSNDFGQFDIYFALSNLEQKGYLVEPSLLSDEAAGYWDSLGIDGNALLDVQATKKVVIKTLTALPEDAFTQAFEALGVKIADEGDVTVVITDNYQHNALDEINRRAMTENKPWMLVKPIGVEMWIGPLFIPGKTGCWECLKQRLDINRPLNEFYKIRKNTDGNLPIPRIYLPVTMQIAANQTALEVVKLLYTGANANLEGTLICYNSATLTGDPHVVVKRPQCSVCGSDDGNDTLRPIVLKKHSQFCNIAMGGYREVSPEETVARYRHHVSPITGVVPKLVPYHSIDDAPIHNYSSGRNTALRSKTMFWLNLHVRSGNGGKGKNTTQAKTGALCEAIERYSLMYHGDEPYITSSLSLLGDNGIHPNACMNFSEAQYKDREHFNQDCSKFYALVPVPFEPEKSMHWTPVYSLTEQRFKYLPSCFCYAQYPAEDETALFSYPDSNGTAAGNSLEEAMLQGLLEVVERDAVALWWYNMLKRPAVDPASFDDPYIIQLQEYYASINRCLYVLDLTMDIGVPVFAAVSYKNDGGKQNVIFGFGAHVDAKIAVERALVEVNQILPITLTTPGGGKSGAYLTQDKTFVDWLDNATVDNQPYLLPDDTVAPKKACDYQKVCEPTIYDSLVYCINQVEKQGMEVLALDMTKQDIGLPVARVIVPGMRHFWRRLAPGRLYDVPVKMGILERPMSEDTVNPIGLFI